MAGAGAERGGILRGLWRPLKLRMEYYSLAAFHASWCPVHMRSASQLFGQRAQLLANSASVLASSPAHFWQIRPACSHLRCMA